MFKKVTIEELKSIRDESIIGIPILEDELLSRTLLDENTDFVRHEGFSIPISFQRIFNLQKDNHYAVLEHEIKNLCIVSNPSRSDKVSDINISPILDC